MKTNALRVALFPLLALSGLLFRPSAFAQGTVFLPLGDVHPIYGYDGGGLSPLPIGNPARVGSFGSLNIQVYYAPVGTASPFTATTASLIPTPWIASSTAPLQQIDTFAGWTPVATFTLPFATGGANIELMVVGWTGAFADWNSAFTAGTGLLAWSGSTFSGGALEWVNGTGNPIGSPPTTPVAIVTGAQGYNGLVFPLLIPEPSTLALTVLGGVMLTIFRRRR